MPTTVVGQVEYGHACELPIPSVNTAYGQIVRCDECGRYWESTPDPNENILLNRWERIGWWRQWRLQRQGLLTSPPHHISIERPAQ